ARTEPAAFTRKRHEVLARAALALKARHARLDRVQHLGHEPEEPGARRAIVLRPVAAELVLVSTSNRSRRSFWSARPFIAVASRAARWRYLWNSWSKRTS